MQLRLLSGQCAENDVAVAADLTKMGLLCFLPFSDMVDGDLASKPDFIGLPALSDDFEVTLRVNGLWLFVALSPEHEMASHNPDSPSSEAFGLSLADGKLAQVHLAGGIHPAEGIQTLWIIDKARNLVRTLNEGELQLAKYCFRIGLAGAWNAVQSHHSRLCRVEESMDLVKVSHLRRTDAAELRSMSGQGHIVSQTVVSRYGGDWGEESEEIRRHKYLGHAIQAHILTACGEA